MKDKVIESRVFKTYIDNGICRTVVDLDAIISIDDAIENTKAVALLSEDGLYPLLVDLRLINSITKEARDHFAMRNRKPGVTAIAMLIKSPVSSIIGNFYLTISKPNVPIHLFTSETKAIKWLQQFI